MVGPEGEGDDDDRFRAFLDRIRQGDEDAARELLTRYEPGVRLVVRRQLPRLLRSKFDSLDFLQSVWGDFFERVRSAPTDLENPDQLMAFLAWTARNKVIDEYRHSMTRKNNLKLEEPLHFDDEGPRELADDTETPSALVAAIDAFSHLRDQLPVERREILDLKAQGYSSKEIGEKLGVSERTVQRLIEDLRKKAALED